MPGYPLAGCFVVFAPQAVVSKSRFHRFAGVFGERNAKRNMRPPWSCQPHRDLSRSLIGADRLRAWSDTGPAPPGPFRVQSRRQRAIVPNRPTDNGDTRNPGPRSFIKGAVSERASQAGNKLFCYSSWPMSACILVFSVFMQAFSLGANRVVFPGRPGYDGAIAQKHAFAGRAVETAAGAVNAVQLAETIGVHPSEHPAFGNPSGTPPRGEVPPCPNWLKSLAVSV